MSENATPTGPEQPKRDQPIIEIKGLKTHFFVEGSVVRAVDGVNLHVGRGECLGVVGESGSGKSVTQITVMGLIPSPPGKVVAGEILFQGEDLLKKSKAELRKIRGNRISMIWQDPMTSLNPFLRVSRQLTEPLMIHRGLDREAAREKAIAMLDKVGIPAARERFDQYPHQFSGGMRQRVMIAMALLCEPELLIADEPTTALDVTIQAQILELIKDLRTDFGTSVVLITHDLGVVAGMAERIVVMYAGRVMEEAPSMALFHRPAHPYTVGLLKSVPRLDRGRTERLIPIAGQPPDVSQNIPGCPFAPRCVWATDECRSSPPPAVELECEEGVHRAHCFRAEEVFGAKLGAKASAEHVEAVEKAAQGGAA
jgi:oligopeptide/dipeptide ABC transporter ATP-binding protein